jgi:hypothetical protein
MKDVVVVPFPRQDWALSAVDDLRKEGCCAELLPGPAPDGSWCVEVSGSAEQLYLIRQSMQPIQRVCWETFINATIAG